MLRKQRKTLGVHFFLPHPVDNSPSGRRTCVRAYVLGPQNESTWTFASCASFTSKTRDAMHIQYLYVDHSAPLVQADEFHAVKQIFLSFVSEFTNASNFYPTVTIYSEITKYYVLKKLRYRPKFINIKGSEQETYKKVTKKFACRWGRRAAAYTVSVAILTFSHPRSIIFMSFKSQYATLIVINSNLGLSRIF